MDATEKLSHLERVVSAADWQSRASTPQKFHNFLADLLTLIDVDSIPSLDPHPPEPYPPNTKCVCGELIHPDMPSVEVEADGGLFHWNAEGGGHRFDVNMEGRGRADG